MANDKLPESSFEQLLSDMRRRFREPDSLVQLDEDARREFVEKFRSVHVPDNFRRLPAPEQIAWAMKNWGLPDRRWATFLVREFSRFADWGALRQRHAPYWMTGADAMEEYGLSETTLWGEVLRRVPARLSPTEKNEPINDRVEPSKEVYSESGEFNPLASPAHWWFTRMDICFFAALYPEHCHSDLLTPWFFSDAIAAHLKVTPNDLYQLVFRHDFPGHRLDPKKGVIRADKFYVLQHALNKVLFLPDEVNAFEDNDPALCGLRKFSASDDMKRAIRQWAERRHHEDSTLTIADLDREITALRLNEYTDQKGKLVKCDGKNFVYNIIRPLWGDEPLKRRPKPKSRQEESKKQRKRHPK